MIAHVSVMLFIFRGEHFTKEKVVTIWKVSSAWAFGIMQIPRKSDHQKYVCFVHVSGSVYGYSWANPAGSAATYAHLRHNQDLSHLHCTLHRVPRWNSVGRNSLQPFQSFLPDRCLPDAHRRRHGPRPLVAATVKVDGVHQSCRRFHGTT